jgi:3-oxosteroid 1-dehydrogenase
MNPFDELFDFVVVGSGAGSMCAALVMRAAGKSVLILEKQPLLGGTTARSGGVMWIPNNRFMARDGVKDSPEQAIAYMDSVIGDDPAAPATNRERRLAYVREAPRMLEFLISQGIKFSRVKYWPDYYDEHPGGSREGRAVVAEIFDLNKLGDWKDKLFPTALNIPVHFDDIWKIKDLKVSWEAKRATLKIALNILRDKLTGKRRVSGGGALQGRMLRAAVNAGVQFRTATPVQELLVEDGIVKGVLAMAEGRPRRIGARLGVLVNAGGFSRNQEMRDRYQPGTRIEWSSTAPSDTGEMIREMIRRGAAIAQMDAFVGNQILMPPGAKDFEVRPMVQGTTAAPHAILVDQSGVRYQNEGGDYSAFCQGMLARNRTVPAIPSWGIFDSQFMRHSLLAMEANAGKVKAWVREGLVRKADTLEELAAKLDMSAATLKATIDRFNGFVGRNKDEDFRRGERVYDRWLGNPFHKPSETLGTIQEGPFYAVPIYPGDVGTFGGVVTDAHARVLREDGSVIPGLYATATSTASVMGRICLGAGSSVGPGFVWGYVAAKHAASLENAQPETAQVPPAGRVRSTNPAPA